MQYRDEIKIDQRRAYFLSSAHKLLTYKILIEI